MSVTPQAPDASSPDDSNRPPTAPFVPQQQGAGNTPAWTAQTAQAVAPQATNTAATTGFVLALVAAVVACIPVLGAVSWILAPLGIVFAAVGLSRATPSRGGGGRSMAIWGIVLGAIALIICTVYVAAIAKAAHTTSTASSGSSGYSAPYSYSAPAPSYTYTPPSYSSGSSSGSSSPAGGAAAAPAADPNTFSAGTYEVGTEIQPGTYKTTGSGWCYYERDKNLDGDISSIIANDNVEGQGVMQVKSSDKYIKFDGTCTWTKK